MALAFYSLDCWWIFSLRIARFKLAFISLQSARQIFCREVFCAGKSARESIANWIERQSEMSFSLYYSYTIKNFVKCFSNRITLRWHIQFQFVVVKTNWNTMLGFLTCSKVFEVLFIWTYHNFDILNNMNTTAKKMRQISGWYGFFFSCSRQVSCKLKLLLHIPDDNKKRALNPIYSNKNFTHTYMKFL